MPQWLSPETERAAAMLEGHPDYRVLRSLPPLDLLPLPEPEGRIRTAAVIDTETTSLDPATGHIIELAICLVSFDARGRVIEIGPIHDWLEDPGYPLSPEIVRLTRLTDGMLAGRRIDDAAVLGMFAKADLLVAHNATFDSSWIDRRYPTTTGMPWCCTLKDVDWRDFGVESRQLGGLLAEVAGFFNARHRADVDVAALVTLLASQLPTGRQVCAEMILGAQRPTMRVFADGAPFEFKGALKARGYRWHPTMRRWWIEVRSGAVDQECRWLAEHAACPNPATRAITWFERHRA